MSNPHIWPQDGQEGGSGQVAETGSEGAAAREDGKLYTKEGLARKRLADAVNEARSRPVTVCGTETREGFDKSWSGVKWAQGGNIARVCIGTERSKARIGGGVRGSISAFTGASRRRLMHLLAGVNREKVGPRQCYFATLTLREVPAGGVAEAKELLQAWRRRFARKYGQRPVIWRLEFTERGVPHFHLLIIGMSGQGQALREFRSWAKAAWGELTGLTAANDVQACCEVSWPRSWRGVTSYCSKYLAKKCGLPVVREDGPHVARGDVLEPGRWWGCWWREQLPVQWDRVACGNAAAYRIRRALCRFRRWRVRLTKGASVTFYVPAGVVERLLEWAVGPFKEYPRVFKEANWCPR